MIYANKNNCFGNELTWLENIANICCENIVLIVSHIRNVNIYRTKESITYLFLDSIRTVCRQLRIENRLLGCHFRFLTAKSISTLNYFCFT